MSAPWCIEFDEHILVLIHDILEVPANNNLKTETTISDLDGERKIRRPYLHWPTVVIWHWFRLHVRFEIASHQVVQEFLEVFRAETRRQLVKAH